MSDSFKSTNTSQSSDSLLSDEQLQAIEQSTISHYNNHADRFWSGTKDHDVAQNYQALLSQFDADQTLTILDFGCGPGRDVHFFKNLGHHVVGLDGSENFCAMAREYTNCKILCQSFLELDLPESKFDAVFANASLFHVPKQLLSKVLKELHISLKKNGVLFTSTPRGNSEGMSNGRYGNYMEFDELSQCLTNNNFDIQTHYYRPEGLPRDEQPWLAVVSRAV